MPKATAVWLVDNTALSFEQIADFCGLHVLEIQGIADGDVATNIIGEDPVAKGLLTSELLKDAEKDAKVELKISDEYRHFIRTHKKEKTRYTPLAQRGDKPDAIAYVLKHYPDMKNAQISRLIGTTKNTIDAIRNREHWNMNNINPRDPVLLGLCTQSDLIKVTDKLPSVIQQREEEAQQAAAEEENNAI